MAIQPKTDDEEERMSQEPKTIEERVATLEKECRPRTIELPVAEVETVVTPGQDQPQPNQGRPNQDQDRTVRVRFKGQRPGEKCLIEFGVDEELIETIHEAKKRNGTIWVRFDVDNPTNAGGCPALKEGHLVVRDLLE